MDKIRTCGRTLKLAGLPALLLFLAFALVSCEKEVHIDLAESEQQLVVEGAIETGLPPYVILSKSLSYFSTIDLETLQDNFVHGAEVTVSDGSKTVRLIEYSADTGMTGAKFYFYSLDTSAGSALMLGEVEKTYELRIELNGTVYEARTKIPNPTPLDSVVSIPPLIGSDETDQRRQMKLYFKDPDTAGNYMRYFTSKNGGPYFPGRVSVFNDEAINGTQFETPLPLGESPASQLGYDSLGYAYPGDVVSLKWCAIDKAVYDFYSTFEFAIGNLGNPFASPTRLSSNISNKAIGVWAGYGSIYTTVEVK